MTDGKNRQVADIDPSPPRAIARSWRVTGRRWLAAAGVLNALAITTFLASPVAGQDKQASAQPPPSATHKLEPLPEPGERPNDKQVALGRLLFFDGRLSGDATVSCATCHDPAQGWCDHLPLSRGYPGTLYFRNTPTILNVAIGKYIYWDGRLPADDLPTVVRDHISEAHFMQADGRLVIERMRQVPTYAKQFQEAFGGEPTYGRILNALAAFIKTLRSRNVPLDKFLAGDRKALSDRAQRGLAIFQTKGRCIECHHGPTLSDSAFHNVGVPPNPDIFQTPMRHITFRRFLRTLGVSDYQLLRQDVGRYAVTKRPADRGLFRTPSLREVSRTAPYMHNGTLATLKDVVAFFNRGGGKGPGKDPLLKPLNLTAAEQDDLVAFLEALAGDPGLVRAPQLPPYELRKQGVKP